METVHLIGQFNKPPKRNRAERACSRAAWRTGAPSPASPRPPQWQGLTFGCLRHGT